MRLYLSPKALPLLFFIVFFSTAGYCQPSCGTDQLYNKLKSRYPLIGSIEAQLSQNIRERYASGSLSNFAKTNGGPDTVIYDVPIVIHIIHDYGVENLSDNDIINAVNYYTVVYMRQNYSDSANVIEPFKKYIGNARIRFHLATIDPDGKPTKGIVREQSYLTNNGSDFAKINPWPQSSYINIWSVNHFSDQFPDVAAYAYYPSSAQQFPYYDGVISTYSYIGYGKVIPHELGHVLNLEHPWGNTNSAGVACGDDEVDDTPPTEGHTSAGGGCGDLAAMFDTLCSAGYLKHYTTARGLDSIADYPDTANAQNIMDYTYCDLMFTKGQVARMRAALTDATAGRNNLYSPANLAATGALAPQQDLPPIADFSVGKGIGRTNSTTERCYFLCANSDYSFSFTNQSWNDTISSAQWILSNGASVPASTNPNFISTTFSQPGWATVTLIANSNAGSDTAMRQAVYVADPNPLSVWGYTQNFGSASDHDNWPAVNYYNNTFKWEWFSGAGYDDGSCMRYRSYDYRPFPQSQAGTPIGDYDDLFTPGFDLTTMGGSANLNFYMSGAQYQGGNNPDTLEIWASATCGGKWDRIYTTDGQSYNSAALLGEFTPKTGQWEAKTIPIPAADITAETFFKFRYKPGDWGNDLYLDKFSISRYATEVKEAGNDPTDFTVFPNPANKDFTIAFAVKDDGKAICEIKDVTGKTLYRKNTDYAMNTIVQEHLAPTPPLCAGVYFVTITRMGSTVTKKLTVID